MRIKVYISYLLTALLTCWIILFYFGVSAGFASYLPIVALFGCLLLFVIAAPILAYKARLGLFIGLLACVIILPFNLMFSKGIFDDGVLNIGVLLLIPTILNIASLYLTSRFLLIGTPSSKLSNNNFANMSMAVIPILLLVLYLICFGRYWSWQMFKI